MLWRQDAPPEQRAAVAGELFPLITLGVDPGGCAHLTGSILFRTALFRSNIVIATRSVTCEKDGEASTLAPGELQLEREILLREDLPIISEPDDA